MSSPASAAGATRHAPARHRRQWAALRFAVGLLLGLLALYALNGDRGELARASSVLARLRPGWLLLAIVAELLSLLSFTTLQRRLLACGGTRVSIGWMAAVSLASLTIAESMPAGPAFSTVFTFRQFRRRGADEAVAGWTILSAFMFSALGLVLLATTGVLLAYGESAGYDLIGVIFGISAVTVAVDAIVWQRKWLARFAIVAMEVSRRVIRRPHRSGQEIVAGFVEQLATVRLTWRDLAATVATGVANWVFDCGCLALAFLAVGAPIPWRVLLLAYGAGQLAQNLPITPGGLGVVEGSLTIALVALGGAETSTVAAVLLYRIITFWGYLPIGWLDWAVLRILERRADRLAVAGEFARGGPEPGAAQEGAPGRRPLGDAARIGGAS